MYLCYLDESGTPEGGNTSHYILAGVSIPIEKWKGCDEKIENIKKRYDLSGEEIHVAWLLRSYREQNIIADFDKLNFVQRRQQVASFRTNELLLLQRARNPSFYRQTKKNYRLTEKYVHLTRIQRQKLVYEIASEVSSWGFVRLFAECIDKVYFAAQRQTGTIEAQTLEQIVSRFEHYLDVTNRGVEHKRCGLLIHDNNDTVAKKHTLLMKKFHKDGTLWTKIKWIIETPLFVNSELTSMVQISDLCSYALRRYLENNENDLFDLIFKRADRKGDIASPIVVGVRHFTKMDCTCKICNAHKHP
ncbi:MAG: DUF3800 domain-containing protein [Candidatus Omnitrophota bacterium]|jgi:hypothetical protein